MKKALLVVFCAVSLYMCAYGSGPYPFGKTWHDNVNIPVKDYMAGLRQGNYVHIDDYMEFLPLTASVLLSLHKDYREGWQDRLLLAGTGTAIMGLIVKSLKYAVLEPRPDGSNNYSFPSGHTAATFTGAELIRLEYGGGLGAVAYTVAIATGVLRMYNEKHWCNDVLAGAGIGIFSAHAAYWLLPWERRQLGKLSFLPYFAPDPEEGMVSGLALNITF